MATAESESGEGAQEMMEGERPDLRPRGRWDWGGLGVACGAHHYRDWG